MTHSQATAEAAAVSSGQAATGIGSEDPVRTDASGYKQYVTFMVGDHAYGVDIVAVREIKQWSPTTALPNQPHYMRGVLNLRGTIVPVHDLRARFGGPETEATENNVIVIVWIGEQTVGVLVDAVSDIIAVQAENIRPVPNSEGDLDPSSIGGLVTAESGMVALLDLDALFGADAAGF